MGSTVGNAILARCHHSKNSVIETGVVIRNEEMVLPIAKEGYEILICVDGFQKKVPL